MRGMMDVRLCRLLEEQRDLVAWWQLTDLGWSRRQIEYRVERRQWRVIHQGVYCLSRAPLSRWQRWRAATLTAPDSYIYGASSGACWEFRPWEASFEMVVRHGSGGPRHLGAVRVARSSTLDGHTTTRDGIPILTAARTVVDLAGSLRDHEVGRCFRESIRLKTTTANEISKLLKGQRGSRKLMVRCDRYATIPYHRCKSDAESRALEVLHDAGTAPPKVNVRVGGEEADLVWRDRRLIVEIDSKEFHQFPDEDARKQARWEEVGFTVRRVAANDVYFHPGRLLAATNVHDAPL